MKRLLLPTLSPLLLLPSLAFAQLHGTHENVERSREPGIQPNTLEAVFVGALEAAHKAEAWKKYEAAMFNMKLELGDAAPLNIQATFATTGPAFTLAVNEQPMFGHDGEQAWQTRAVEDLDDAEVHVRMLRELPALVYRLRADDVILNGGRMRHINEQRLYAATLERPQRDDWSILLVQPQNDLLHAVAYFIRTSEDDEPAFSPAYAMVAADYQCLEDVPLARQWHIWRWSRPRGFVGEEPIGKVTVDKVAFTKINAETFKKPVSDDQ